MQLDGGQGQLPGDVAVLDLPRHPADVPALDPLGGQAAGRDGGGAAEGLELGVCNPALVVHLENKK